MSSLNNLFYQNKTQVVDLTIQSGSTLSDPFSCFLPNLGCGTLRAIDIPSNFTLSDIFFLKFADADFLDPKLIHLSDGVDQGAYVLPAVDGAQLPYPPSIMLVPAALDSVVYLKVMTSVPQAATVTLKMVVCANIYDTQA